MDYPGKVITKNQVTPTQTSASGNWTLDDAAAAVKNNNWPVALVPNPISKSLRFNSADSAYLNRTFTTPTNNKLFTWSGWVKRCGIGVWNDLFGAGGSNGFGFNTAWNDNGLAFFTNNATGGDYFFLVTTQVFRDPSSWYHIVLAVDTTQATASNRAKLYVNGSQITAFNSAVYQSQNSSLTYNSAVAHYVGSLDGTTRYMNGYMTEVNFIDGQALTPSSFGMTNPQTGQWIPIKYSGTYGTNGFYLNFKDATSTTTLGYDYSGNANNWTTNNFSVTAGAGNDSLTDVPTPWVAYNTTGDVGGVVRGNYCTMNPLDSKNGTASNGNLLWTATASQSDIRGTFAIPASGKWYMECTVGSTTNASSAVSFGLATSSVALDASNAVTGLYQLYASSSGFLSLNGTNVSSSLGTWTAGDVLQIAVDVDNTKMWLGKNNTWYNSSGGTTGNPSTGANETSTTSMVGLFPFSNCYQNNATWNAGQRPFAYTPPAGFLSLCSTNLPTPTIGATSTTQANDYFDILLYNGNNSASTRSITGLEFQPDFIWIKNRNGANSHRLTDAVRGSGISLLSNSTSADVVSTTYAPSAFISGGFQTTTSDNSINGLTTDTYVAWNWKAAGSTVTNTAGTITSTVSANTTAGFAIATTTGAGGTGTIGHGLGAVPQFIMCFRRNTAADHYCYHQAIGNTNYLVLNTNAASAASANMWNNTTPTSTVFSVGNTNNNSGDTYVHYIFAPVAGYSAFGSYTGNGSADGPFVYCGFRPRYVLVKRTDSTGWWHVWDTARNTYNLTNLVLFPNDASAEATYTAPDPVIDILSNGFKNRGNYPHVNASGGTYIYAAFAESPFKFANAR